MIRFIVSILFASFLTSAFSPRIISAETATKHIGETVKIVDKVYSSSNEAKEVVLKIGGSADHQCVTVIIKTEEEDKIKYTGYNIHVTGKLVKYKGVPTIFVDNPQQIGIVMADHDLRQPFN